MKIICMYCKKEKYHACCSKSVINGFRRTTIEDRWRNHIENLIKREKEGAK
jgi:hypothetical protein